MSMLAEMRQGLNNYNTAGLTCKASEKITKVLKNAVFDRPLSYDAHPGNPCEYSHKPNIARN